DVRLAHQGRLDASRVARAAVAVLLSAAVGVRTVNDDRRRTELVRPSVRALIRTYVDSAARREFQTVALPGEQSISACSTSAGPLVSERRGPARLWAAGSESV